jgi:hypothetical protein
VSGATILDRTRCGGPPQTPPGYIQSLAPQSDGIAIQEYESKRLLPRNPAEPLMDRHGAVIQEIDVAPQAAGAEPLGLA